MILYFTSDKNANVKVEIPAVGYTATYTVTANQVTLSNPLPKAKKNNAVKIMNIDVTVVIPSILSSMLIEFIMPTTQITVIK